jgi:phage-related protein
MSNSFKGDFLGFTFNNIHSSELGIVRVNTGNRGYLDLSPQFKDDTIEVPGSDGIYYLTTQYQQKQFQVSFAFDNVSEANIKTMRTLFSAKEVCTLIFDEEPYRSYDVKVSAPVKLSYICFDNADNTARVYKGEGDVIFTAFYPFAKAPYKTWTEYVATTEGGRHYDINGVCIEEWLDAANLKENLTGYDEFVGTEALLYNPGDVASPMSFVFQVKESGYFQVKYTKSGDTKGIVIIDTSKLTNENYYRFNSKTRLLEGGAIVSNIFVPNGLIYNQAIIAGDFFSIEPAPSTVVQKLVCSSETICLISQIQYDYLYI